MYNTSCNLLTTMGVKTKTNSNTSIHAITLKILKEHNKPMTIKEITPLVLKQKKFSGKNPRQSISSILQRSQYVKRVSKGTFQLINN